MIQKGENLGPSASFIAGTISWRFEKMTGDIRIIKGLLNGEWSEDDYLRVEPGQKIIIGFGDKIVRVSE